MAEEAGRDGPRRVLVTGVAGFIGFHVAQSLLARGDEVVGFDDLNPYYDPALKAARLGRLAPAPRFRFERLSLGEHSRVLELCDTFRPTAIVHLAAQAGVRHSLEAPRAYVSANVDGFLGILEACRARPVDHLVYASSSSVYGSAAVLPFTETDPVSHPASLYAATKRANELMADSYAHLFGVPATGLRFFTVYGPWGRPDMAYWRFTDAIAAGTPIELFNEARMSRDFTFVDDAVEAVVRILDSPPPANGPERPHRLVNVGSSTPVPLTRLVDTIATAVGRPARTALRPMQPGDVVETFADTRRLRELTGFRPSTPLEEGIRRFVAWHADFTASRA